jgi:uncharacterized protein YjbI with pentapeptide repeats
MADTDDLALIRRGVRAWNRVRNQELSRFRDIDTTSDPPPEPKKRDLMGANLRGAQLRGADLGEVSLNSADLRGADLRKANLQGAGLASARLRGADLRGAILLGARLSEADLRDANMEGASLIDVAANRVDLRRARMRRVLAHRGFFRLAKLDGADLRGAELQQANLYAAGLTKSDLRGADLTRSTLVDADLTGARLDDSRVFGVSAWRVKLDGSSQSNLHIAPSGEPDLIVDDLEVAQFIYLLADNQKLRNVIDTVTSRTVLILGRFTDKRKPTLDAMKRTLRARGWVPVLFDFTPSTHRNLTETITLLAKMARFVIADLTDPKSIPQELTAIIRDNPSVPIRPILSSSQAEYALFKDWTAYPWVLPVYRYDGIRKLISTMARNVIAPAEAKAQEIIGRR